MHEILDYGDSLLVDAVDESVLRWSRRADGIYEALSPDFAIIPPSKRGFKIWEFEPNGTIWIARNEFIFRYDPNVTKDYFKPYKASIRSVEGENNQKIFMGTFTDPAALVPALSYDENALTFQYAAPFYEYHDKIQFTYKLAGFDKAWSPWEKSAEKEYTNLPEGAYTFRVKAKNIYGHESRPAEYRFIIHPPWYRTVYAYLGYAVSFLLVLYTGIRWNTRRLQASKVKLEKIVKERTKEIEAQKVQLEVAYTEVNETKDALWGEMQLAQKIQTVLLPDTPQLPGYDITAYMQTADEVGGDYYDVIQMEGTYWLVIGDVSGHGVPAGLVNDDGANIHSHGT
ncbi:MAG: triple tyrosine motif-containing protein [Myxococcota bacterium]|nr:triple tyrosine motif-containing protein [Myxococcota bacterium]